MAGDEALSCFRAWGFKSKDLGSGTGIRVLGSEFRVRDRI